MDAGPRDLVACVLCQGHAAAFFVGHKSGEGVAGFGMCARCRDDLDRLARELSSDFSAWPRNALLVAGANPVWLERLAQVCDVLGAEMSAWKAGPFPTDGVALPEIEAVLAEAEAILRRPPGAP